MSQNTLEQELETAYGRVTRTYETGLAAIRINCSSFGLNQQPVLDDESQVRTQDLQPLPVIILTATSEAEEEVRNSGAYGITLEIQVKMQAVQPEGQGPTLDELFYLATRPLLYVEFVAVMGTANPDLRMHGINKRALTMNQDPTEAAFIRRKQVIIHCALTTPS